VEPATQYVELSKQIKLNYVEQGDPSGIPVLLLHGIAASNNDMHPTRISGPLMCVEFAGG
jgi:hypothetical protein